MPSYPAYKVSTPDGQINVLQITDLHLSMPQTNSNEFTNNAEFGTDCQQSFEAILKQALNSNIRCDLILVTGDLVSDVKSVIYDYIFTVLHETQIPFACIAGNHDVTDELGHELPFKERKLVAQVADARLLSRHMIDAGYWQLLLINSAIPGKVAGEITATDINWICAQLEACHKPTLLALHHHVMPMNSDWIDEHIADNAAMFWQRVKPFSHLHTIISGHTHQEKVRYQDGVTVYNTPSTCYQFKPNQKEFAYDHDARPGYRWLQLANNGQVASWVERLDT